MNCWKLSDSTSVSLFADQRNELVNITAAKRLRPASKLSGVLTERPTNYKKKVRLYNACIMTWMVHVKLMCNGIQRCNLFYLRTQVRPITKVLWIRAKHVGNVSETSNRTSLLTEGSLTKSINNFSIQSLKKSVNKKITSRKQRTDLWRGQWKNTKNYKYQIKLRSMTLWVQIVLEWERKSVTGLKGHHIDNWVFSLIALSLFFKTISFSS